MWRIIQLLIPSESQKEKSDWEKGKQCKCNVIIYFREIPDTDGVKTHLHTYSDTV